MYVFVFCFFFFFFFSSRRRHTRFDCDWSSDVCSSDLKVCCAPAVHWWIHSLKLHAEKTCSISPPTARPTDITLSLGIYRSEERRVGKECRSRWWRYH